MEPYIEVKILALRQTTKTPSFAYQLNNIKYFRVKYSNPNADKFKIKVDNLFKFTKKEFLNKWYELIKSRKEKILYIGVQLIVPYKDQINYMLLYEDDLYEGGKIEYNWFNSQQELDELIATVKNM